MYTATARTVQREGIQRERTRSSVNCWDIKTAYLGIFLTVARSYFFY